jgi:hypothetical protein
VEKSTPASKAKCTEPEEKSECELHEQARALRSLAANVLSNRKSPLAEQVQKKTKKETLLCKWIKRIFPATVLLILLSSQVFAQNFNDNIIEVTPNTVYQIKNTMF